MDKIIFEGNFFCGYRFVGKEYKTLEKEYITEEKEYVFNTNKNLHQRRYIRK